jgi:hypothetical protein
LFPDLFIKNAFCGVHTVILAFKAGAAEGLLRAAKYEPKELANIHSFTLIRHRVGHAVKVKLDPGSSPG